MHITRKTAEELVVVDGSRWIAAIAATGAVITLLFAVAQYKPKGFLVAAFFLVVAMIADRNTVFTFDAMQRVVRWNGRKLLKAESGTIAFDAINDIGTEVTSSGRGSPSYRLTLITPQGTIPMAYAYEGRNDAYAKLRGEILDFIGLRSHRSAGPGDAVNSDLEASLRSLLAQGRKIDAITLLRTNQKLSLTQAAERIDEFDKRIRNQT